jgi:hypothetical protein
MRLFVTLLVLVPIAIGLERAGASTCDADRHSVSEIDDVSALGLDRRGQHRHLGEKSADGATQSPAPSSFEATRTLSSARLASMYPIAPGSDAT